MFGIGSTELLVILVVALIVLGPKSLAGVSRSLGKAMGEFRRASTDFQRALNVEVAQEEQKEKEKKDRTAENQENKNTDSNIEVKDANIKNNAVKAKDESGIDAKEDILQKSPLDTLPPDSPVAVAINKARVEAESATCAPATDSLKTGAENDNVRR